MPELSRQFKKGTEASYKEALYLLLSIMFEWDSKLWLYRLNSGLAIDGCITPQTLGSLVDAVVQRLYENGT